MPGKSIVLVTVLALTAGPALAQRPPIDTAPSPDELRNIFTFQVENDVFNRFGKSDRDYTNGVRLGWLSPALPDLPDGLATLLTLPTFFGEGPESSVTRRAGLSVGQNLYTPADTDAFAPIYNDRPYAGWLYASFALQSTYKRHNPKTNRADPVRLDTLQLDLGLVGPSAGGEFVQNTFHRLIGVAPANGWANQLYNEPTVGLTFERRWRTNHGIVFEDPKFEYDFVPRLGGAVGNAATYASVGGTLRIGKELRRLRPVAGAAGTAWLRGVQRGELRVVSLRRCRRRGGGAEHVPRRQHRRKQHRPRRAPAVRCRGASGRYRPVSRDADQLHAGAAHAGVLRARSLGPVRIDQRDVPVLTSGARRNTARSPPDYKRPISSRTITIIRIRPAPPLG
jgi:hypothetical protein